jgi:putative FmdB family regulatory protein
VPLYEYECRKCHHRFEVIQSVSDKPIRKCPNCKKGTVQKLLSSPALRFKGSGWYVTDYGGKGSAPPGEGTSGSSGGETSGKDSSSGGDKSEKKSGPSSGKSSSDRKPGKKD